MWLASPTRPMSASAMWRIRWWTRSSARTVLWSSSAPGDKARSAARCWARYRSRWPMPARCRRPSSSMRRSRKAPAAMVTPAQTPRSEINQAQSQAEHGALVVVADHAVAMAAKQGGVQAQAAFAAPPDRAQGLQPFQAHRSAVAAGQRMAHRGAKRVVLVQVPECRQLGAADVVADAGVVIAVRAFRDALPDAGVDAPAPVQLDAGHQVDPVPTARQGLALAIGLVHQSNAAVAPAPAKR